MAKYTKRKDGRYSTNVDFGYKDDGSRNRIPVYGKTIKELEEKKKKYELEQAEKELA